MGYEVRMHVVQEITGLPNDPQHGIDIGHVDLCKIGSGKTARLITKYRSLDSFGAIWADDGDSFITTDRYDDKLVRVPMAEVIKALDEDFREERYRRFRIALAFLTTVWAEFAREEIHGDNPGHNLFCYFYGH